MSNKLPNKLINKIAYQKYEERIKNGIDGNSQDDWNAAIAYLNQHRLYVFRWRFMQLLISCLKFITFPLVLISILVKRFLKFITFPLRLIGNLWGLSDDPKFWQSFNDSSNRSFSLDVVKTIISSLGLVATIAAAIGLIINYNDNQAERKLNQERLVTDRFSKAVEQLGKANKEEVAVRTGGIYALERIAKNSPEDHWTVMEVLTAYVRSKSPLPSNIDKLEEKERLKKLESQPKITIDVQSALTVIGRRISEQDNYDTNNNFLCQFPLKNLINQCPEVKDRILDLSSTNLREADLREAYLFGAYLFRADLREANLFGADLSGANLFGADLIGANLSGADLYGAYLIEANLIEANLSGANLIRADLSGADLIRADLSGAYLYGAKNLDNTQIKLACNWEQAIYTERTWDEAQKKLVPKDPKANTKRIEEIKNDKASNPQEPPYCKSVPRYP